jgi:hypothetical protein
LPASASSTRRRRRRRESTSTSASAGPPAPAWNTPSRRTGACGSNISTASSTAPTFASLGRAIQFDARLPAGAHRPQPQDRLAGIEQLDAEDRLTDPESDRWEIHGQTTYLPQGYPAFRAPYTGTNSLTPARQAQATWSNSLYLTPGSGKAAMVYYQSRTAAGGSA